MFWFFFDGAQTGGSSPSSSDYGASQPPIGFLAHVNGARTTGSTPSTDGQYGTSQPPIGFWAFVNGAGIGTTPSPTVQVEPQGGGGNKRRRKRRHEIRPDEELLPQIVEPESFNLSVEEEEDDELLLIAISKLFH